MFAPRSLARIAVAAICLGLCIAATAADDKDTAKKKAETEKTEDAPYRAKLPDGIVVEFVGLSESPSEGKPWWRPDGTPLPEPPKIKDHETISEDENRIQRTIVLRATGLPRDTAYHFDIPGTGGATGSNREGKLGAVQFNAARGIPKDMKTIEVMFECSVGGWQDVMTVDGGGLALDEFSPLADHIERSGIEEIDNGVSVKIGCPVRIDGRRHDFRVIAIDATGERKPAEGTTSAVSGDESAKLEFKFPLALDKVAKFVVQAMPYRFQVTFKDVAVNAGQQTKLHAVVEDLDREARK